MKICLRGRYGEIMKKINKGNDILLKKYEKTNE